MEHSTISPEIRIMIQDYLSGEISESDFAVLQDHLRQDIEVRAFYIDQAQIDGLLEYQTRRSVPMLLVNNEQKSGWSRGKIISVVFGASAAGIAATFMVMSSIQNDVPHITPAVVEHKIDYSEFIANPNAQPVARITGVESVEWATSSGQLEMGHWLSAGKLDLKQGVVEVTYDSGASVTLQGPAIYYIQNDNRGFLESGKIKALTSELASLEIHTPSGILKNSSAEVGVSHLEGETELHVFEGEAFALCAVDVNEQWHDVQRGDAIALTAKDSRPVYEKKKADINQFAWAAPSAVRREPLSYVHWTFNTIKGNTFVSSSRGFDFAKPRKATLQDFSGYNQHSWQSDGVFGKALSLSGGNRFVTTNFAGISGSKARTIAFWVRLPKIEEGEKVARRETSMLAWGRNERGHRTQIKTRKLMNQKIHSLRTDVSWGYTAGETHLHDGQWHHICVVFTGDEASDSATHILQYVDGRLEQQKSTISSPIDTKNGKNAIPVTLGLSLEGQGQKSLKEFKKMAQNGVDLQTFRGEMDELFIFDDALTPREIQMLIQENKAP